MRSSNLALGVLGVSAVTMLAGSAQAASLVGDLIQRVGFAQSSGGISSNDFAIVQDPGVEFIDTFPIVGPLDRFDVGPDYIRMDSLTNWFSPWFDNGNPPSYYEFRDLDFSGPPGTVIGGVLVEWSSNIQLSEGAPLGYAPFGAQNVTWNADTVRIQIGPYLFPEGAWVHITLLTVPAPAGGAMAVAAGLVVARRRRR